MLFLFATILLNVVISSLFKLFPNFKIDALQAIVVNYGVCIITGSLYAGEFPYTAANFTAPWAPWALLLGVCFISIFNLIAFCTRVDGITTTTIANKLSLVIPVLFAVLAMHEPIGWMRIVGVALAFPAVYLATRVKEGNATHQSLLLPILLFAGSGLLDTLMNYVQHHLLPDAHSQAMLPVFSFSVAGVIGSVLVAVLALTRKIQLHPRNIIAGICVGVPNYFSIYFLIRTLNSGFLESSAAIPIMNIGIVVASAIAAIVIFREQVNPQRIAGLLLSVLAILLIAFGNAKL